MNIATFAPIIHLESKMSSLPISNDEPIDKFHPIKVEDLGSLARLTYDPEFPEEYNLALYLLPHKNNWLLGYITALEMDDTFYQFNYIQLESKPNKPFLKYRSNDEKDPEFSDTFEHGYSYLPLIHIKQEHPIFGL